MHLRPLLPGLAALAIGVSVATAQDLRWQTYRDPGTGYRIDVPAALLEPRGEAEGKVLFEEPESGARLTVYAADAEGQSPAEIAAELERAGAVREVTYRRGGASWFVLSGYYAGDNGGADDLIFYLKLMMSPDRSRYAVFAVSYPQDERDRFDPVVERMEDSFRGPASP